MKRLISIFVISILGFSCGKIENSNSLDDILYGNGNVAGSPQFLQAKAVLDNNCYNGCHQHAAWKSYAESDFVAMNLAKKADLAGSKIYTRLKGSTAGTTAKDMPPTFQLTAGDITAMETWINSIP